MKMMLALFIMFGMILLVSQVSATAKYPVAAGGNWGTAGTWTTDAACGAGATTVPTNADTVTFPACAGAVTCDVAICNTNSLTFQNAANSLTVSAGNTVNITGNVVLFAGMTLTAGSTASRLLMSFPSGGVVAVTPAGINWGGIFQINGVTTAVTVTLNANWQVDSYVVNSTAALITLNGNTLTVPNGVTPTGDGAGSTILSITGGHLYASNAANHRIDMPITLTSGNIAIDDGFEMGGATPRNFIYSGGTVTVGDTLKLGGGMNWNAPSANVPVNNLRFVNSGTLTFNHNITLLGWLGGGGSATLTGASYSITANGIETMGSMQGTINQVIIAGGTAGNPVNWSRSSTTVHTVPVTINCNYLTIKDTVSWGASGQRLHYVGGNVDAQGQFTFFANSLVDTQGMTFNNINVGGTATPFILTLQSNMNVRGNTTVARDRTFQFLQGNLTTGGLLVLPPTSNNFFVSIPAGNNLTVTDFMDMGGWSGDNLNYSIKSGTAGNKAYVQYKGTKSNLELMGIQFVDIDARSGKRLDTWFGLTTNSLNVRRRTPNDLYNFYGAF